MQTLLHWFVSQAFFVVEVSAFNEDGTLNTGWGSISNCGFSPLAMICAMVLAVVMMLLTIILRMRRFPAQVSASGRSQQRCNLSSVLPRSIRREDCLYGFEVGLAYPHGQTVLGIALLLLLKTRMV